MMAESKSKAITEHVDDDDWEEIESSQPDDTISILSESETIANDQAYVEVDHPKKTSYPGRIYSDPNEEPQGPLPMLRRSLYALKDTLMESIEQLNDFNDQASMQALAISGPLAQAQQRQVSGLTTLLTNCASDWEAYANTGGMTFDEFAELNPVSVDELRRIFQDFVQDVRMAKYSRKAGMETDEGDEDEPEKEIAFLDFILPAVDEVNTLLRIEPLDSIGLQTVDADENRAEAETLVAKKEDETKAQSNDEKVHEKMMMVSDW
jgi:hypothetical protein